MESGWAPRMLGFEFITTFVEMDALKCELSSTPAAPRTFLRGGTFLGCLSGGHI